MHQQTNVDSVFRRCIDSQMNLYLTGHKVSQKLCISFKINSSKRNYQMLELEKRKKHPALAAWSAQIVKFNIYQGVSLPY
ncbi:hypothetical protein PMSM_24510 [Paenibacillus macquariensis subsp. macquariensis]|uniref:Uncharacterized protein n=1 Tax=Paenibacillus macquariensis TaxID=948756 RepID=A0ABY1KHE8_9BACL|nr:hypothetical protein PMSM_24510 [Paenibacillus macquariensis subsp. macquariensis]SIR72387.1 hypothetical protein SAMN05421578_1473 [Paenibacillus macquariensis]